MRPLAIVAALALIPTGALALSIPQQHSAITSPLGERAILGMASPLKLRPWMAPGVTPLQTGGTATPTAGTSTPTPTATPSPTPAATGTPSATATTYPDPVTLLRDSGLAFSQVRTAHFELITDGEQTGIEKVHIDIVGDVTCKGPALKGRITGTDTLEATSKVSKINIQFILVKKKAYQKGKSTNGRWKKASYSSFSTLGVSADQLLLCPSSQTSTSGSGSTQLKDLVDLGPSTFQGHAVWHIRGTEVGTDANGNPVQGTLDLYISQDHYLPYLSTYTQNSNGVILSQKEIMTKFGEKLKIKAPKIGSTKP